MTDTELVELAATKVMGWVKFSITSESGRTTWYWAGPGYAGMIAHKADADWSPFTSLDDAEMLIQQFLLPTNITIPIQALNTFFAWWNENAGNWLCWPKERKCRAILMAALEAVGVEVGE